MFRKLIATGMVTKAGTTIVAALAACAAVGAADAPPRSLELSGQPARGRNILASRLVTDRETGHEMLALTNNNEGSGLELIFVDMRDNTARVFPAPAGSGAPTLIEIPGDRLAVGTFYDAAVLIFDLKTMAFIKSLKSPGDTYIFRLAVGGDNRLYAGTFPGGKLLAIDLATYVMTDLGSPSPPNKYLHDLSTTPDGRVLCFFMVDRPEMLIYDPVSNWFDRAPSQLQSIREGAVWNGFLVAGNSAFEGRDFLRVTPVPFPLPLAEKGEWAVDTALTTPQVLYIRQGAFLWQYRKGDSQLTLVTSIDLRGGRFVATTDDGRAVGVRGQDYFVIKPADTTLDLRAIPGDQSPRSIQFLRIDPAGRLWGGPPYGQTLFWMDLNTGHVVNTQTISNTGGEVYDVVFLNGMTYAAAYSGGEVIRYDPNEGWDQFNQKNPKTIASFKDKGYNRPTGGIIAGPGQKLYSGWSAQLGTNGGAVAITDPGSGETTLLENPFGPQEITGVVTDGNLLYVGSGFGISGLPSKPGELSQFGIIDAATGKVTWQLTVPGAVRVRPLGYDRATHIVPIMVWLRDSTAADFVVSTVIRLFNTSTRAFVDLPQQPPTIASWSNGLRGDGRLYYGSGKQVVRLDLFSGAVTVVAATTALVSNVTTAPDGTVYVSAGVDLFVLRRADQPFTDDTLINGVTPIRAVHITELRHRIDAVRRRLGLAEYAWLDATITPGVTAIDARHITDLRQALKEAYLASGLLPPTYSDPTLTAGNFPRTAHITELRSAVVVVE